MMSAKMVNLALLKVNIFWNKNYDIIVSVNGFANNSLSRDSNYIVDVVMSSNFGNSGVSMREVIIRLILWGFAKKNYLFWGMFMVQVQLFGIGTRYDLEILCQCFKRVKTKS